MKLADYEVGAREPLFLIAGPCVIESAVLCEEIAGRMLEITRRLEEAEHEAHQARPRCLVRRRPL